MTGGIEIIAHRGASRDCPENTFAALDEALAQGCDAVEVDVQLTRDEIPVCFHDRDLRRLGREGVRISDLSQHEVRELRPGAGFPGGLRAERIPRLKDLLERYGPAFPLLVEVKTREGEDGRARHEKLMRLVVEQVRAAGLQDTARILCFDSALLDLCARQAPELTRVLNVKPGKRDLPDLLMACRDVAALCADIRTLDLEFAGRVRAQDCPLMTYTCNTPEQTALALESGAVAILSDRPGWLRRHVAAEGARR